MSNIAEYSNRLLFATTTNFQRHFGNVQQATREAKFFCDKTLAYFEALLKTGLIEEETFPRVFDRISNAMRSIDFLPENERNIYGKVDPVTKTVYINPNLSQDRKILYFFHELTHCCFKDNAIPPVVNDLLRHSTYYGYMTIEEALAQDIAETCFYKLKNLDRPRKQITHEYFMPDINITTNLDYYGLYQPLAIAFGRTLNGVAKSYKDNDDVIMFNLSKKALKEDLLESAIEQYQNDTNFTDKIDIERLFFSLANVYSAKLKSFGISGLVSERVYNRQAKLLCEQAINPNYQQTQEHYKQALNIMNKHKINKNPIKKNEA